MPKTALITGARTGIGRALAERFLEAGWTVHGCSRDASDLRQYGYTHHLADVTDEREVVHLLRALDQPDAVVNNAGTAVLNSALLVPAKTIRDVIDVNLVGTMLVCREAAKAMRRAGGAIVNLTSVAVPLRLEGEAAYVAAKAGVEAFTRVFAREIASWNVTVNAVGPGPVETALLRGVSDGQRRRVIDRLVPQRLSTCEEVWQVVRVLIETPALTGQIVYLGGAG